MDEYIKRSELHDLVNNDTSFGLYKEDDSGCDVAFSITEVHKMIDKIPSADVAEVKRGKWIRPTRVPDSMLDECSICGFDTGAFTFKYCPNCGARMDGGT